VERISPKIHWSSLWRQGLTRSALIFLMGVLVLVTGLVVMDVLLENRLVELELAWRQELAQRRLGTVILRKLESLRGSVYEIALMEEAAAREQTWEEFQQTFSETQDALEVLQLGGEFELLMESKRTGQPPFVLRVVHLKPDADALPDSVLELGPLLQELYAGVDSMVQEMDADNVAGPALLQQVAGIQENLYTAIENGVQLFHGSRAREESLQQQRNELRFLTRNMRQILGGITFLACLVGFIAFYKSARNLLKKHRLIEHQLEQANRNVQRMFDSMPVGLLLVNRAGKVCEINQHGRRITGYEVGNTMEEPLEDELFSTFTDRGRGSVVQHQGAEEVILTRDGRQKPVLQSSTSLERDGERMLLVAYVDVKDRKAAEERLRKLSKVVEQSPVSVVITDNRGRMEYVNPWFTKVTGYLPEEALGKNPSILQGPERDEPKYQDLWKTVTSGRVWRGEFCNRKKNGDVFWEDASISPLINEEGKITHYVAVKQESTHIREQQQLLEEAKVEAERANHAKSQFLANMSHEIRTPMNGVVGMASLLMDSSLNPEQQQYAETVKSSAEALLVLINDILDVSKIEAGKLELESSEFDLPNLLEDCLCAQAVIAENKHLELICALDPDLPVWVLGDQGRLRQVVSNLLSNALKFTEQGAIELTGSVIGVEPDFIEMRFGVRDSGIGIPKDKVDRLFQNFTQVDASHTRRFGGTGLGLAICKELCAMMGGSIGVNSDEGQGSEFWFTVRLQRAHGHKEERAGRELFRQKHVVVVDDHPRNRALLQRQLENWGLQVHLASSATELLRRLEAEEMSVDLFVLDLQMPEVDGLELSRRLQGLPAYAEVPRVLLSTINNMAHMDAEKHGFVACLFKPLRLRQFRQQLLAIFDPGGTASVEEERAHPPKASEVNPELRILLAEDNRVNQRVALGMLKRLGLSADCAENGEVALRMASERVYDLIFMDVQMPVMDGLSAVRHLRGNEASPSRRSTVIAMTANALHGDREDCLAAGMDDYISKPITLDRLRDLITNAQGKEPMMDREDASQGDAAMTWSPDDLLESFGGDRDMVAEVAMIYLEELPAQIDSLKAACAAGDVEGIRQAAHSIKGASVQVDVQSLGNAAAEIENLAKEGQLAEAQEKLAAFLHCAESSERAVRAFCEGG